MSCIRRYCGTRAELVLCLVLQVISNTHAVCENENCVTSFDTIVITESPPKAIIVAGINDTVNASCGIYNIYDDQEPPHIVFNDMSTSLHTGPEDLTSEYGVIDTVCNAGVNARCTTTVKVKATKVLPIHCQVGECCTASGYIYGVNVRIPDPPGAPLVEMISTLSLNISWNSPWSYPVNNYTLIITNNSTGLIEDTLTLNDTYYIMHKPENLSCEDVYLFSVSANTDLGPTDISQTTSATFLSGVTHHVTTVALLNTTVIFNCSWENTMIRNKAVAINGDMIYSNDINSLFTNNGITVQSTIEGLIVTIIASEGSSSNTIVQCFLDSCLTHQALIITVESPPTSVSPPIISIISSNSLLISWSPPWVHPIYMYYLTIVDYSMEEGSGAIDDNEGTVIGSYAVEDTQYWLNNSNGFECSILSVTVQAVTDVGTTSPSNETRRPFYKGLKNTQVINSTKEYWYTEGARRILNITFEPPPVCDHEKLRYVFKLKDLQPPNNEVTKDSEGNSSVMIELSNYLFHDNVLMISVEVNVSDGYTSTIIQLYDNITVVIEGDHVTSTSDHPSSSSIPNTPATATSIDSRVIIGAVCGGVAAIVVICVLTVIIAGWCYHSKSSGAVLDDGNKNIAFVSMVQKSPEDVMREQQELKARQIANEINLKCGHNLHT